MALAAGLMSYWTIFLRVVHALEVKKPDHTFVTKPILSGIVWVLLVALVMPIFVPILLFDEVRHGFTEHTIKGALDDKN